METFFASCFGLCLIAKKTKKKKVVLSLGEFLGDDVSQIVTTSSKSWADEMEQMADGKYMCFVSRGVCNKFFIYSLIT